MLPSYYFYWSRIDNKHMTESSLDQALMAYMNVPCYYKDLFTHKDINTYIMVKKKIKNVPCEFVTHLICMKNTK